MNEYNFPAAEEDNGQRLDKWISEKDIGLTRSAVQNLILSGNVFVNQKSAAKNYKLRKGDSVKVIMPEPVSLDITAENIPLDIVFEDSSLLVVNKPKGMVVHPAPGNYSGTLVNALMYHCGNSLSGINGVIRPGIVHRIDKNTSGLLIVAKNDTAHQGLAEQIKAHSFMREYEAVAMGRFKDTDGIIDAPIGRHHVDRKKMCVTDKNSKNAVTHYHIIEQYDKCAYLRLRLETGRTHQIRVHLSYKGHPILGDDVYGKPYKGIEGQCLHARKIGFIHPESKEYMEFDSELPDYFKEILRKVR
ncbi:MAG: RluA family pseudouridine synthase [Oscillospiraceae bacterium]|nr:RluA family pseudouridine synthase [Oscillospiraceae bacterium]